MAATGHDPGIVGVSYQAPMTLQDAENAINWYVEVAEVDDAKAPVALLGAPGLALSSKDAATTNYPFPNTSGNLAGLPVRGVWVLPGGASALAVIGKYVLVVTIAALATATAPLSVSMAVVGIMSTATGQVCIRDNGALFNGQGGFAVIVDGTNSLYYYNLAGGPTSQTFTAIITSGSNVITLPGTLPTGLMISPGVTISFPLSVSNGGHVVSINYSAVTITLDAPQTGSFPSGTTATINTPLFGIIADPGFLGATRVSFIEGWLLFNQPNSRSFFTNGPTPYTLTFPGTMFALKDSSTDNIVTMHENDREQWFVGERTSEVWYNAGNATGVAFSRVPAVGPQIGSSATQSIARMGQNLVWLAANEQGQNIVIETQQYSFARISNHAIETAIASYPVVSDAVGYAYEEAGHLFYMLTFPTQDVTWCYDKTASEAFGKPCWHQRASFNQVTGQFHRHISNCYMNFGNARVVGDFSTGNLYAMSRTYYTDNGAILKCQRRTKHVWSKETRGRVFQASLQIEFTPGVGLQTGQGSNPQAMLRWSNDGGFSWSNEHWQTIGLAGKTRNRAKWNRLGEARDRVYEVNFTDPVARDIIGATLFGEAEE